MKSLIIGKGQIGSALFEIFSTVHECQIRDIGPLECSGVAVLHIAFPYSDKFVEQVKGYVDEYKPSLTIIHSSVAVGTTRQCGAHVVHSPERGRHPNLAYEMKQFPKFIGGLYPQDVALASHYFEQCDWRTVTASNPDLTEILKLISNVHMGLEIAWRQEVERMLEKAGAKTDSDFLLYSDWEDSYNKVLRWLNQGNLARPRMSPRPIGGHCILPCTDILSETFDSLAFKFIRGSNAKRQEEERAGSKLVACSSR